MDSIGLQGKDPHAQCWAMVLIAGYQFLDRKYLLKARLIRKNLSHTEGLGENRVATLRGEASLGMKVMLASGLQPLECGS